MFLISCILKQENIWIKKCDFMYKFILKRILDIILSSIAIIILCPILVPVAAGLLFTGEHYIFYLQERIGYKNLKFNIYKFATMLKDSPNIGTGLHTTLKDPRILPMGGFLRKTKINELPQLINILIISNFLNIIIFLILDFFVNSIHNLNLLNDQQGHF